MGSLKVLLVCATLVVAALGKNDTPVRDPTRSLTSGVPGPTPTPHPPPPALNTIYNYTSPVSKTCTIMLNASMVVTFTYTNTTKEALNTTEELDGVAVVDKAASHCRDKDSAALVLTWNGTAGDPRLLSFNFTGNGPTNWEFKNLTLTFNVTDKDFPDYPTKDFSTFANFSRAGFFDEVSSKVEYQRSYQCSANTLYKFNNFTNQELKVTIDVTNFQVQAFEFKDNKIKFGNARACVADGAPGSKIVPIAVGAALGVLVIAVIVAYVISKVVNRKKSSYEAL